MLMTKLKGLTLRFTEMDCIYMQPSHVVSVAAALSGIPATLPPGQKYMRSLEANLVAFTTPTITLPGCPSSLNVPL
jgi:hypothetical protein